MNLFKKGYPFKAPANKGLNMNYKKGICPNAEKLYYQQIIVSEHIRPPNTLNDLKDIIKGIEKLVST